MALGKTEYQCYQCITYYSVLKDIIQPQGFSAYSALIFIKSSLSLEFSSSCLRALHLTSHWVPLNVVCPLYHQSLIYIPQNLFSLARPAPLTTPRRSFLPSTLDVDAFIAPSLSSRFNGRFLFLLAFGPHPTRPSNHGPAPLN
jgi:hypothetical protein